MRHDASGIWCSGPCRRVAAVALLLAAGTLAGCTNGAGLGSEGEGAGDAAATANGARAPDSGPTAPNAAPGSLAPAATGTRSESRSAAEAQLLASIALHKPTFREITGQAALERQEALRGAPGPSPGPAPAPVTAVQASRLSEQPAATRSPNVTGEAQALPASPQPRTRSRQVTDTPKAPPRATRVAEDDPGTLADLPLPPVPRARDGGGSTAATAAATSGPSPQVPKVAPPVPRAPMPRPSTADSTAPTSGNSAGLPPVPQPRAASPAELGPVAKAVDGADAHAFVQLASYRSREAAEEGWTEFQARYPDVLGAAEQDIQPVDLSGQGRFYRLRAAFPSEGRAAEVCRDLQNRGIFCRAQSS